MNKDSAKELFGNRISVNNTSFLKIDILKNGSRFALWDKMSQTAGLFKYPSNNNHSLDTLAKKYEVFNIYIFSDIVKQWEKMA
jgi:hypothetical protein